MSPTLPAGLFPSRQRRSVTMHMRCGQHHLKYFKNLKHIAELKKVAALCSVGQGFSALSE